MDKNKVIEMAKKFAEEELAKLNDISFLKQVIRISEAGRYYTNDSKMFKNRTELDKYLKENKINAKKIKFVDDWGGKYCWHKIFKVIKKNGLLFVFPFYVEGGVTRALEFNRYIYDSILIIDKNGDIIAHRGNIYRNHTDETTLNKVKKSHIPFYNDDIDHIGEFKSGETKNDWSRAITEQTKKLFVDFFGNNISESAKTKIMESNTSHVFWENVIRSFKKQRVAKNVDPNIQELLEKINEDISSFAKTCMTIRYDNFIIYYNSYRTQFYDITNGKKYAIAKWSDTFLGPSFQFEPGYIYIDECSDRKAMMKYRKIFSNIADTYDKNGDPITASECFAGCYVENVLYKFKDKIISESISRGLVTIGELNKNGIIPTFIVRGLFTANAVKQRLDLMINSNLFYAYKGACNITPGRYYRDDKFEKSFKNKGKSMSVILELPNNKIRKIEDAASKLISHNDRVLGFSDIYNYLNRFSFVDLKSMNDKQFDMILNGIQSINIGYNFSTCLSDVYRNMNKPLSSFLEILFKNKLFKEYGVLEAYRDYLNMRSGIKSQCDQFDEDRWPILPGKTTKAIVTLRSESVEQIYTHNTIWKTAKSKLEEYEEKYNFIEILSESKDRIVICITMNQVEAIKYLHDEITPIFNLYKNKVELGKFKEAVKRVEPFVYENEEFAIIAPQKPDDLAKEGSVLHHCVNSFTSAIIRGSENIVFLRRKSCIDTPFFTIALDNNRHIEQIHCYCNGNITIDEQKRAYESSGLKSYENPIDIIPFLNKWCKDKKITGLQNSYGALCAH